MNIDLYNWCFETLKPGDIVSFSQNDERPNNFCDLVLETKHVGTYRDFSVVIVIDISDEMTFYVEDIDEKRIYLREISTFEQYYISQRVLGYSIDCKVFLNGLLAMKVKHHE